MDSKPEKTSPRRVDLLEGGGPQDATGRPWLGVWFSCANSYVKVYRSADGSAYNARCPKCGQTARFAVGRGGVSTRFFEVRC